MSAGAASHRDRGRPLRVLVLSSVFPNPKQPAFGVFVRERMLRVAAHCELQVVAPVPWFPLNRLIRGAAATGIPWVEEQDGLTVYHPRFFCVPRYLKPSDGVLYACSLVPFLRRLRRRFPFDVIDAHFAYPDGVAAALLGRLFRCPVVITLRGSIVRLAHYRYHRPQIRWALTRASRVLAVSESLKQVAVHLGLPPSAIRVIPNGVDVQRFRPLDREQARRTLGLPTGRPMLLSVGGLNVGKGHHRIVGLLPQLRQRHPDLLYVIVGGERPGDSSRAMIEQLVQRHGAADAVLMAGERPHDEIPRWLAATDVFCLATRSEGWANVLLESMACGRPVVTTHVGGNAEIVTAPTLGRLVPRDDDAALVQGILDALERPWDTDALVDHARAHSWEAAADAVVEELSRAVRASTPRGGARGLALVP